MIQAELEGAVVRLLVGLPVLVLVICSTAIGLAIVSGDLVWPQRRAGPPPRTGMQILNAHACGRGETKQILLLGVEDGFSPAGSEAGFIRPGRSYARWLPREGAGQYDQVNIDRSLADSFKVEGPVAGGVLVYGARSLNGSDNDGFALGALDRDPNAEPGGWIANARIPVAPVSGIWTQEGEVLHADLARVGMSDRDGPPAPRQAQGTMPFQSLLSFLNLNAGGGWLDIFVQDDTAIDFIGLALCRPPVVRKGLTLMPVSRPGPEHRTLIHLNCHAVSDLNRKCEPYVGDTVCSAALPVACLRPGHLPSPVDGAGRVLTNHWSGGDIAATQPVRGDRFRTVADVDAFCAHRFGPQWRIAAVHDGGRNQSLSGRGDPRTITDRVWVDIADQPHGACWARK